MNNTILSNEIGNLTPLTILYFSVIIIIIAIILRKLKFISTVLASLSIILILSFLIIRPFCCETYSVPTKSMVPTIMPKSIIFGNKLYYHLNPIKHQDIVLLKAPSFVTPERKPYNPPSNKKDHFIDMLLAKDTREVFVKRVIGLPGDTIRIQYGYIIADEERYNPSNIIILLAPLYNYPREQQLKLNEDYILFNNNKITKEKLAEILETSINDVKIYPGGVFVNGIRTNEPYTKEDPYYIFPSRELANVIPDFTKIFGKDLIVKDNNLLLKVPTNSYFVMGDNRRDSDDSRYWGVLDRGSIIGKATWSIYPRTSKLK